MHERHGILDRALRNSTERPVEAAQTEVVDKLSDLEETPSVAESGSASNPTGGRPTSVPTR